MVFGKNSKIENNLFCYLYKSLQNPDLFEIEINSFKNLKIDQTGNFIITNDSIYNCKKNSYFNSVGSINIRFLNIYNEYNIVAAEIIEQDGDRYSIPILIRKDLDKIYRFVQDDNKIKQGKVYDATSNSSEMVGMLNNQPYKWNLVQANYETLYIKGQKLPFIEGYNRGSANLVSDDGKTIVGFNWIKSDNQDTSFKAVVKWDNNQQVPTKLFDLGFRGSSLTAMSYNGKVIIGIPSSYTHSRYKGFYWKEGDANPVYLENVFKEHWSENKIRSYLGSMLLISKNGKYIYGTGNNEKGQAIVWQWKV